MADRTPAREHWDDIYSAPVEQLPWYAPHADAELISTLAALLPPPARLLDIGCGPGTTAADLAARQYDVLGVDISPKAIDGARQRHGAVRGLRFACCDILHETVPDAPFGGAIDRGAFGTLPPELRERYVRTVATVLEPGGPLLLKVFSIDEPGTWGPNRFSRPQLRELFGGTFIVERIDDTVMPSTLPDDPRTLFAVLRRS